MVEYHSNDFDLEAWGNEASRLFTLPEITEWIERGNTPADSDLPTDSKTDIYSEKWNSFYNKHQGGDFFKPRRYLSVEFGSYLSACREGQTVLEVGCGHGCSMSPIIDNFPVQYVATDYSAEVLDILQRGSAFDSCRCSAVLWDVTQPASEYIYNCIKSPVCAIVSVFALSAVHPDKHVTCFENMRDVLLRKDKENPGVILFRDYGIHDVTMYRHKQRHGQFLFGRADGTLAYYFDLSTLKGVAEAAGLNVLELEYATVRTANRKTGTVIHRVFVHAVLSVSEQSTSHVT